MNQDKTSTQEEAASQKLEQKNMPIWHSPAWLTAIAGIISIFMTVPEIVGNYLSKQQDIELAKQKTESLHLGNTDSKQKQEFEIINNTLAKQGDERIFMLRYLSATLDDADAKKWAEKEVEILKELAIEKERLEQKKLCSEEAKKQNAKVDRLRQIAGLPIDINNDKVTDFTQLQCLRQNNKKMIAVPLTGFVCDPDGNAVTVRITSITSDEPIGKDPYDASGIGTDTAWLRQERDAHGDGRVYVITFVASDGRGGETTMQLSVRVPHNQNQNGCDAVDSGQKYDAATKPSVEEGKGKTSRAVAMQPVTIAQNVMSAAPPPHARPQSGRSAWCTRPCPARA